MPEFPYKSPLLKVCGLTRRQDVVACVDLGIDLVGFIFVPDSPRAVTPGLVASFPTGRALRVGVFAGLSPDEVLEIAAQARLDLIQLHGGENVDYCRALGRKRLIKVLWPENMSEQALQQAVEAFSPCCSAFLFDAGKSGGGSGRPLQWKRLARLHLAKPWFLAGGLNPDNFNQALQDCRPTGLDFNSGVEIAPGVKDIELVKQIMRLKESANA